MGSYCSALCNSEEDCCSREGPCSCCFDIDNLCRCCCLCLGGRSIGSNSDHNPQDYEHLPPSSQQGIHPSHWCSSAPTAQKFDNSNMNPLNAARYLQRPMQYAPMVEYIPTSPATNFPCRQLVINRGVTNPINHTVYLTNHYAPHQNPLQPSKLGHTIPHTASSVWPQHPM